MKYAIRFFVFVPALLTVGMLFAQSGTGSAVSPAASAAAAPAAPAAVAPAADSEQFPEFDQKFQAYEAVLAEIQTLKVEFDKAYQAQDNAKMTEIQNSAAPLIQKAEQTFKALIPAAVSAYKTSKGTHEKLNQLMLVYANYLLTIDEYDEAFALFKMFLSKGMHKKHPEIFEMAGISAFGANNFAAAKQCFTYAEKAGTPLSQQASVYSKSMEYYESEWARELQLRKAEAQADDLPRVLIRTTAGDMTVELFENEAPNTVSTRICRSIVFFRDSWRRAAARKATGPEDRGTRSRKNSRKRVPVNISAVRLRWLVPWTRILPDRSSISRSCRRSSSMDSTPFSAA